MGTTTKALALREDLNLFNGVDAAATRIDSTGGTLTGRPIGDAVDILSVYGSGTTYTDATLSAALAKIGSSNVRGIVFAVGTWTISNDVTIPSNITPYFPPGCLISVASGKDLTINVFPIAGSYQWIDSAASGTVTGNFGGMEAPITWWHGALTAATSASTALTNALKTGAKVKIPSGNSDQSVKFLIDSKVTVAQAYNNIIEGNGEDSILELNDSGYLIHETTSDKNRIGYRRTVFIRDLSFISTTPDATAGSSRALVLGDDALSGANSAAADCTFDKLHFRGFEKAVDINMIENITFNNIRVTLCSYAVFSTDASNASTTGLHMNGGVMNNCELAAFCWLSNDSNSGLVNLTNMLIHTNVGWGIYLRGQSKTSNLPHILDNLHLENNGTSGSNVTVDGTSRDPQTIYLEKCFAKINGGFLAGNASGPQIKLVNARLGVDGLKMGGGMSLSIFDADTDSIITLDNISILTGIFNTEATIEWGQGNQVSASSGTSQVVGSRIPKDNIKYLAIPDNSMTDPSFEYGIGNIGGSSSNNPTITSSSDQTIIGARSLKAVYNASTGTSDDNAVKFGSSVAIPATGYCVFSFFVYSSNAAPMEFQASVSGSFPFTPASGAWTRYAGVIYNETASPSSENIWIYPTDSTAPTCYFDGVQVSFVDSFLDAQSVLQGGISEIRSTEAQRDRLFSGNPGLAIDSNMDVQNVVACDVIISGSVYTVSAATNCDTGTAATFPTAKWGIFIVNANTSSALSAIWNTNSSSGFDSEAAAIAAVPTPGGSEAPIGYVTVQAHASNSFTAGTDALQGGTGGNVSQDTNYYNRGYI